MNIKKAIQRYEQNIRLAIDGEKDFSFNINSGISANHIGISDIYPYIRIMKILSIIILMLASSISLAQAQVDASDSIKAESDSARSVKFQYRISLSEVSSSFSSKDLRDPIFDLFKAEASYSEALNQFVLISEEDIDQRLLVSSLGSYHITYFRKIPISYQP